MPTACCVCPHCGYQLRGAIAQLVVDAMEQHILAQHPPEVKLTELQRWTVGATGTTH